MPASSERTRLVLSFAGVLLAVSVLSALGSLQSFADQSARVDLRGSGDNALYFAAAVSLVMSMLCAYGAIAFVATLGGRMRRMAGVGLFVVTVVFMVLGIAEYGMWSSPPVCPGGCG